MRHTLGTAVFSGMIGVTLFGSLLDARLLLQHRLAGRVAILCSRTMHVIGDLSLAVVSVLSRATRGWPSAPVDSAPQRRSRPAVTAAGPVTTGTIEWQRPAESAHAKTVDRNSVVDDPVTNQAVRSNDGNARFAPKDVRLVIGQSTFIDIGHEPSDVSLSCRLSKFSNSEA